MDEQTEIKNEILRTRKTKRNIKKLSKKSEEKIKANNNSEDGNSNEEFKKKISERSSEDEKDSEKKEKRNRRKRRLWRETGERSSEMEGKSEKESEDYDQKMEQISFNDKQKTVNKKINSLSIPNRSQSQREPFLKKRQFPNPMFDPYRTAPFDSSFQRGLTTFNEAQNFKFQNPSFSQFRSGAPPTDARLESGGATRIHLPTDGEVLLRSDDSFKYFQNFGQVPRQNVGGFAGPEAGSMSYLPLYAEDPNDSFDHFMRMKEHFHPRVMANKR